MDIDALAVLAADTIVVTAVTDAFEGLRAKVARIFGRGEPDPDIQRRLDATRQQLTAIARPELERERAAQARRWETRFADLLADYPEAAGELRALLAKPCAPDAGGNVTNTVSGTILGGPVLIGRDFGDVTVGRPDDEPGG